MLRIIVSLPAQPHLLARSKTTRLPQLVTFSCRRVLSSSAAPLADTNDAAEEHPELKVIPSLPIVGSMVPLYSGIPALDLHDLNNHMRKQNKEWGPFYSIGFPGIGSGWHSTVHIVRSPQEMLKVLKHEGIYPSGSVETQWPVVEYMKRSKWAAAGLFGRGEEWKRLRQFIQKDFLSPVSAKEYLPFIIKGAAIASKKAATSELARTDIVRYLNYSAVDMFSGVLFGGPEAMGDDYDVFATTVLQTVKGVLDLMIKPMQIVPHKLGIDTRKALDFYSNFGKVDEIAKRCVKRFAERAKMGDLTEEETQCYAYKALERREGTDVTPEEATELMVIMLIAAVDTTATVMSWNLLHLAVAQDIQEELREQLDLAVQKHGGLTPAVFEPDEVPLLSAVVRESHRCTPAVFADLTKKITSPAEVYGVTLPAGSTIQFDALTNMMDPELVEEPMSFNPKRWLKEAVEARKDTPAAIIDHPFYSGPFSQGSRRCPASRVAKLEIQAMIAQLLLDYKITGPDNMHWSDVESRMQTMLLPVFPKEVGFEPRR